jgi:diguanylate cyclase (GGDEF)-like protein
VWVRRTGPEATPVVVRLLAVALASLVALAHGLFGLASVSGGSSLDIAGFRLSPLAGGEVLLGVLGLATTARALNRHRRTIVALRRATEGQSDYRASRDELNGMADREAALRFFRALRPRAGIALIVIELDGLKAANDTYGPRAGDTILASVTARIRATAGAGDGVFRLRGDEIMVVVVDAVQRAEVEIIGSRLIKAASRPCTYEGATIKVDARAGAGIIRDRRVELDAALEMVDTALHQAKRPDLDRVVVLGEPIESSAPPGLPPPGSPFAEAAPTCSSARLLSPGPGPRSDAFGAEPADQVTP